MMQILAARATTTALVLALLWLVPGWMPARAEHVADLFTAVVPLSDESPQTMSAAFGAALKRVIIKLTGREQAADEVLRQAAITDPGALVQQYSRDGSGNLWVRFDGVAVRRVVDAAGMPVWGENRPLTLIWLTRAGGEEPGTLPVSATDAEAGAAGLRSGLLAGAADLAVPVVFPLGDAGDLAAAGTGAGLPALAQRYHAEAILLGEVRQFSADIEQIDWTLMLGAERLRWQGMLTDGARGLAERLSQRLAVAAAAGAGSTLRLAIAGIDSLDRYGLVLGHLRGLDAVAAVSVLAADGDVLVFAAQLRGSREQFDQALALHALLESSPEAADAMLLAQDLMPQVGYRLSSQP